MERPTAIIEQLSPEAQVGILALEAIAAATAWTVRPTVDARAEAQARPAEEPPPSRRERLGRGPWPSHR